MADKQKILIVDDDEHIAELISLYLLKECYETRIAPDGEHALSVFDEFAPDAMVLDIMLVHIFLEKVEQSLLLRIIHGDSFIICLK